MRKLIFINILFIHLHWCGAAQPQVSQNIDDEPDLVAESPKNQDSWTTTLSRFPKAFLDGLHSIAINAIKSPLCFLLASGHALPTTDRAPRCPNHLWTADQKDTLLRALDICDTYACRKVRANHGRLYRSQHLRDKPSGTFLCGGYYKKEALAEFEYHNRPCTYTECSAFGIPDHGIMCTAGRYNLLANKCFDQKICKMLGDFNCPADKHNNFWQTWMGQTNCDPNICPGLFVPKQYRITAATIKESCRRIYCQN